MGSNIVHMKYLNIHFCRFGSCNVKLYLSEINAVKYFDEITNNFYVGYKDI